MKNNFKNKLKEIRQKYILNSSKLKNIVGILCDLVLLKIKGHLVKWALKDMPGTAIKCSKCGSPLVTYSSVTNKEGMGALSVNYHVKCEECLSTGYVQEVWSK